MSIERTTHSSVEQITPVTDQLARALAQTFNVLGTIDSGTKKLNDRDHYHQITTFLELLAVATLSATSSQSLIEVNPAGARFNIASGTELARQVSKTVAFLRNDASDLLRAGDLSQYERKNTDIALGHLRGLYGLITDGIARQARKDTDVLLRRGPNALIQAAESLAKAASTADSSQPVTPEDTRSGAQVFPA